MAASVTVSPNEFRFLRGAGVAANGLLSALQFVAATPTVAQKVTMTTRSWFRNGMLAAGVLAFAPLALAHGGMEHVMGTVVSADAKSIVVKTPKGVETTIQVDEKTKVERSGAEARVTDLAAGERVVVHAHKGEAGLTAMMIKAGATKAGGAVKATGTPAHHHSD